MLKKLSRYYHTIKHLKPIQIRYQVWNRLRDRFFPVQYPSDIQAPKHQQIKINSFPNQYTHYLGDDHFRFLNLEHSFKDEIDWNYLGHGKLWAYHLNYFDFLHQEEMDWETGLALIEDFLENPQAREEGLEPYPISLRTINWIKFITRHQKYPQPVIDALYAHYQVLSKKIEYHLMANHLLENGFSFLFGAVLFKEDKKLNKLVRKVLLPQLNEQILNDGAHFELSPMYHLIILQRALDAYNLLQQNQHNLPEVELLLKEKVQKMVNWLSVIRFSNGGIPLFNDSVAGQALESITMLNYAKQLGFKPENAELSDSGYRKFSYGGFELVADAGNIMPFYQPGHAHADALSFVLYYQGKPIIVDRGTSTYETNELRKEERSTASHNTVVVNERNQSDVWGAFRVGKRAHVQLLNDSSNKLKASHNGYLRYGVQHNREWIVEEGKIIILDKVESKPESSIAYFYLYPDCKIQEVKSGKYKIGDLFISFRGFKSVEIDTYLFCAGFNKTREAKVIKVAFVGHLDTIIHS